MALFGKKENEKRPPVVRTPVVPKTNPKNKAPDTKQDRTQDTTCFGKGLKISGNVSGEGNSDILGSFEGELDLSGQLKVAQGARIKGNIKASDIYINGSVEGTITASKKIHLDNTARIKGRIITPKISILEGSVFDGEILMSSRSAQISRTATPNPMQTSTESAATEKK